MNSDRTKEFYKVSSCLQSAKFDEVIENIRTWPLVWLIQFNQRYPEYYDILKLTAFDTLWAEKRAELRISFNPHFTFSSQKYIPDIDFVLGYLLYLAALQAKKNLHDEAFNDYLTHAIHFNSFHARQTYLHHLIMQKTNSKSASETILSILHNWEPSLAKHGTPGYLLLANNYLHLVVTRLEIKDEDESQHDNIHFYLWKNLVLAELVEPLSQNAINNAYFGEGLKLSNFMQFNSLKELKDYASKLIKDNLVKEQAEHSAHASFDKENSQNRFENWLKSKNKTT
ncbi:Ankyrin repeat protein [Legionella beliardensis]|uniref:Ankyrin repeat protein n=1 Tax=Legionella beliardensis TaxID=91822 RepID=A0A378I861_9GAMM|nr:DUF5630 domain-containing protein [Legionella beliardensis]STX28574.1 Ankyrin repeat protein [Legionella beliardensis]